MDINKFKSKILEIHSKAEILKPDITNIHHIKSIESLLSSISHVYHFVLDDNNLMLLNLYSTANEDKKLNPLGNLCHAFLKKIDEFDKVIDSDIFGFISVSNGLYHHSIENMTTLSNKLREVSLLNLISAFNVLKHLNGHNKTLIVLGPNGSGKTSFANYLKNLENHIKVIPASKPIRVAGYVSHNYSSTLETYNNEIYSGGNLKEDLLQKLIIGLCTEHDNAARILRDTGERGGETTYEKVKKIFDDFFEVKLDNSAFAAKEMQATKNGQSAFKFNEMSDGERVAFFYIATVIAAPANSFIIVDEPENHLNPAIYNKIWDRLIEARKDCQFIFISHTIDFIRARSNFELVKIKSFVRPDKFEFEFLGSSLEDIKSEHIVEIVGSRKPILFCEGVKDKYDYKIYESLFGAKYTVIPTESCESVKSSVAACNTHASTYSIQSAIGVIDSDLKSDSEIENLKDKNIYALRCNEIEMLLLDEYIFKAVLQHLFMNESEFEKFKSDFMSKINARKDHIIKRLVKIQIDEKLATSKIDDRMHKTKEGIKLNLSNILSGIDIDTLWRDAEERITKAIEDGDYEAASRLCCLEHKEIIGGIVNKTIPNYDTIALGLLNSNKELAERIRNKYFPGVPMNV